MVDYILSNKADGDLTEIYLYSYRTFGEAKADAYFLSLRECLQTLAENPRLGRPADTIRPGLSCYRHARHIVFYVVEDRGIFVVRVLHDAMDVARHFDPAKGEEYAGPGGRRAAPPNGCPAARGDRRVVSPHRSQEALPWRAAGFATADRERRSRRRLPPGVYRQSS